MRAYKVTSTVETNDGEGNTEKTNLLRYAGSQSEVAQIKREWLEKHGLKRSHPIRSDEEEIPTSKADLVPWLNKNFGVDG